MISLLLTALAMAGPAATEAPVSAEPGAAPQTAEPAPVAEPLAPLRVNRTWQVLSPPEGPEGGRAVVHQAGEALGAWTISVAGIDMDGAYLTALAETAPDEPFLRVLRETTKRPFDLPDFLLFLDDVLAAGEAGRRGEAFWMPVGRLRSAGVIVHPDEVFKNKPRKWGRRSTLAVDQPQAQAELEPAVDGDLLGPRWTTRFRNPSEESELLQLLLDHNTSGTYAARIACLMSQIRLQGGEVYLTSTVRSKARGYLMWGAFVMAKAKSEAEAKATLAMLEDRNAAWALDVPIAWWHPDGWEATRDAARAMADSYDVVYATEKGARYSNHYGGQAADVVAIGLPRSLSLHAPDGALKTFDLSDPNETRDLSMSPQIITWIERHFQVSKLRSDYPHWNDRAPAPPKAAP